MTTDYHTPITFGTGATTGHVNSPLGELDGAIGDLSDKVGTGADAPNSGEVLTGTGGGASGWAAPALSHDHSSSTSGVTLAIAGGLNVSSFITAATMSGDVGSGAGYNPNGGDTAFLWRLNGGASPRAIYGIASPSVDGALHWIANVGSDSLVLKHNSGTCTTAADRLYCPGNSDLTVSAGENALIVYDGTDDRWRVMGT